MADVKKLMVPWLEGLKHFFSEHLEKAWEDKSLIRMMSNEGRDYIEDELAKVDGLTVYHTHGNYILIDASPSGTTTKEIVGSVMGKDGIILRKQSPFKGKGFSGS